MNPEVSGYTTPFPLTHPLSPRGEGWGEGADLTEDIETKRLKQNINNLVALNLIQGLRLPSLSLFSDEISELTTTSITDNIKIKNIWIKRFSEKYSG